MLNQRIRKRYYKTLGNSVINSPLSPLSVCDIMRTLLNTILFIWLILALQFTSLSFDPKLIEYTLVTYLYLIYIEGREGTLHCKVYWYPKFSYSIAEKLWVLLLNFMGWPKLAVSKVSNSSNREGIILFLIIGVVQLHSTFLSLQIPDCRQLYFSNCITWIVMDIR